MIIFTKKEKEIGEKLYRKFFEYKTINKRAPVIGFRDLYKLTDQDERRLVKKILSIDPKEYGKKGVLYGIKPVPKSMKILSNQRYFSPKDKKLIKVKTQYLPMPSYVAFQKLRKAMQADLGKTINIVSGYRSPAFQAMVLFIILREHGWDPKKTLRRVTLPGYSEHGYPARQAMDFAPVKGIAKLEDFDRTDEFKWLMKNAKRYGFNLSFPRGNKMGVMYEPWHWAYDSRKI